MGGIRKRKAWFRFSAARSVAGGFLVPCLRGFIGRRDKSAGPIPGRIFSIMRLLCSCLSWPA
jgi:hypothetical protein